MCWGFGWSVSFNWPGNGVSKPCNDASTGRTSTVSGSLRAAALAVRSGRALRKVAGLCPSRWDPAPATGRGCHLPAAMPLQTSDEEQRGRPGAREKKPTAPCDSDSESVLKCAVGSERCRLILTPQHQVVQQQAAAEEPSASHGFDTTVSWPAEPRHSHVPQKRSC